MPIRFDQDIKATGFDQEPEFLDSQGMPLRFDRAKKPAIEEDNDDSTQMEIEARKSGARAGQATLRRGIFLQSLVSSEGGERSELLGQLEIWNRAYVISGRHTEQITCYGADSLAD
jgi:hypothetical protein